MSDDEWYSFWDSEVVMDRDQRYYNALFSRDVTRQMMFGYFVENYHRPYKEGEQSFGERELSYMFLLFLKQLRNNFWRANECF